jgi:hypothetical protein
MKKLVAVATACALGATVSAYATPDSKKIPTDPATAIAQAKAAVQKTDAVGFLWRDTEELIKGAEAAAAKDDAETALNLAIQALHQAENGYKQYERSQKVPLLL